LHEGLVAPGLSATLTLPDYGRVARHSTTRPRMRDLVRCGHGCGSFFLLPQLGLLFYPRTVIERLHKITHTAVRIKWVLRPMPRLLEGPILSESQVELKRDQLSVR